MHNYKFCFFFFFFFKQKTAYEITYGDWSSDVCSSDLPHEDRPGRDDAAPRRRRALVGPRGGGAGRRRRHPRGRISGEPCGAPRPDRRAAARDMTGLFEGVGIALDSLRANKGRAALTILGVAIGVMVVIVIAAMISITTITP